LSFPPFVLRWLERKEYVQTLCAQLRRQSSQMAPHRSKGGILDARIVCENLERCSNEKTAKNLDIEDNLGGHAPSVLRVAP
jgi:hypothetical protein